MPAETVQLTLKGGTGGHDAKQVIANEMAQVRQNDSSLPKLAKKSLEMNQKKYMDMNAPKPTSSHGLPSVKGGVQDKLQAARYNAAILAGSLGHPGLDKMMAKEASDKKKRKQRLLALGYQQGGGKTGGQRPGSGDDGDAHTESVGSSSNHHSHHHAPEDHSHGGRAPGAHLKPLKIPKSAPGGQPGAGKGKGPRGRNTSLNGGPTGGGASSRSGGGGRALVRGLSHNNRARGGKGALHHGHLIDDDDDEPGVRPTSRVGRLLAEFASKDDWVSQTILRHQLATVIQANVRGWLIRRQWHSDPHRLVFELHARLHAEKTAAERRERLRKQLEQKTLTAKQKKTATSVMTKIFGSKALTSMGGSQRAANNNGSLLRGKWGALQRNYDVAAQEIQEADAGNRSDESEFSDLEMEDIAAVKLRARTPPWQKIEQSQWVGQYNKLNSKLSRGKLEVFWDLDKSVERLYGARERRLQRKAEEEAAAQAEGGEVPKGPGDEDDNLPGGKPLPPELITELLLPKYIEKYARLGLLDHNPMADKDADGQLAAAAAAAAAEAEGREGTPPADASALATAGEGIGAAAAAAGAPAARS